MAKVYMKKIGEVERSPLLFETPTLLVTYNPKMTFSSPHC
jgi:hypothetical protein